MIEFTLSPSEIRVLGSLMEKEMTTPEYYPLSLNALVNACNQKSNRNPVVSYDEETVLQALDDLTEIQLVVRSDAARVSKFEHLFGKRLNLVTRELAIMCVLLLRGPQTVGELRTRCERMYGFADLEEVSETLSNLAEMDITAQMARKPGQKEARFTHLLAGEQPVENGGDEHVGAGEGLPQVARKDRITALEEEVSSLRSELDEVKQELRDFKQQFE